MNASTRGSTRSGSAGGTGSPRASSDRARLRVRCPGILSRRGSRTLSSCRSLRKRKKGRRRGAATHPAPDAACRARLARQGRPGLGESAGASSPCNGRRPRPKAARASADAAASFTTVTIRYAKAGQARYMGHLDTVDILLRAVRSAGISLKMHGKYHPKPRISLSAALPVGIESACEMMEVEAQGVRSVRRRPDQPHQRALARRHAGPRRCHRAHG